ncbi:MAG: VOC family protein [Anaerolineae bacterium]|nr:VOC family protein [Anaerolineae bacterium]
MKINQILETCLYVDDLEVAEQFYTKILGIEPFSRVKHRHIFFRCGAGMLLLFNPIETAKAVGDVPTHGAHGPGHVAFAISSDEIAACREHLRHNGVSIETEITWPSGGQSIYFRDPAGNSLEFATKQVWA